MSLLDFKMFRLAWWLLLLLCSVVVASKNENHHANLLHPVFRMRIRRKRTKVLQRTCTLLYCPLLFSKAKKFLKTR